MVRREKSVRGEMPTVPIGGDEAVHRTVDGTASPT
jgi:hypothetical protein